MGRNGERVEQVDTMSGFWVSGGGSAPGNLAEMEWKGRYLEITGQKAQSVGWINHRGHCEPMAVGSACKGSGQEGGEHGLRSGLIFGESGGDMVWIWPGE